MFGNEMLFTSWFFSSLIAAFLITLPLNSLFEKLPNIPRVLVSGLTFLSLTYLLKISIAKAFNVHDDAHVFELLKSKFTDYKSFHTLLYTCAVEFDFLGWEMPWKTSATLLLPSAALATVLVIHQYISVMWRKLMARDTEAIVLLTSDPASLYNVIQMAAYALMAVLIMRLKLFFTPQLCVVAALLASRKFVSVFKSREVQVACLVGLVAAMSVQGVANIREQRQIMGEYQNPDLEQLIDWVEANLPREAVLGGPMPTMANLLLSTRRPVVNHPHYEDSGIRARTKKVYTVFSRRSKDEVHRALSSLQVEYLVLHAGWCLSTERNGCALTEVMIIQKYFSKINNCIVTRFGTRRSPSTRRRAASRCAPCCGTAPRSPSSRCSRTASTRCCAWRPGRGPSCRPPGTCDQCDQCSVLRILVFLSSCQMLRLYRQSVSIQTSMHLQ